jgi:hypothetical protein
LGLFNLFEMPNQLASSKKRTTLADHAAVLAALAEIARRNRTTVSDLLRAGARKVIREHLVTPATVREVSRIVHEHSPKMPKQFKNARAVSQFKIRQREFDALMVDLQISAPAEIQRRNSVVRHPSDLRVVEFSEPNARIR